jgi:hypothetical protein
MSQPKNFEAIEAILKTHKGVNKIWQCSDGFLFLNENEALIQEQNLKGSNAKPELVYEATTKPEPKPEPKHA